MVLEKKTYTALAVEHNGKYVARLLFTVDAAKRIAAVIANKVSAKTLNRVLGVLLVVLGLTVLIFSIIKKF